MKSWNKKVIRLTREESKDSERKVEDFAVILIGHGSALPYNKDVLESLGKRIEKRGIYKAVRVAFMQVNLPGIEEVLRSLAKEGMKNIVAQPVFLAEGAHTKEDISERLKIAFEGAWQDLGRDVTLTQAKPIGADERIVDILLDRVNEAIEEG